MSQSPMHYGSLGTSPPRLDGRDKVLGTAKFARDMYMPGMVHGKMVLAGRPHARILSIDDSSAKASQGVLAVFTASDVPNNRFGIEEPDQPVFCEEKVRFVGDRVALVIAETYEGACAGAKAIRVVYEDLPVISDMNVAMQPETLAIHNEYPGNIAHRIRLRLGDSGDAIRGADIVVERTYSTPPQEHAFLEPEAGIAYVDSSGVLCIETAGQSSHEDRRQVASVLGLAEEMVRVRYGPIGGAFGGREDISVQIMLALATMKLGRPVRLEWTREESILCHPKRHAMVMRHKWGATVDGRIVAAEVEILADAGAYFSSSKGVLDKMRYAAIGPYEISNVSIDGWAIFTNNVPSGAFRGSGSPQATFGSEMQVNHIAEEIGMDPLSIRLRNCLTKDSFLPTRAKIPEGIALEPMIKECVRRMGGSHSKGRWKFPHRPASDSDRKRGLGLALAMKNSGLSFGTQEQSTARVVLRGGAGIDEVELHTSAADVGQGSHTAFAQIACQVLGVDIGRVSLTTGDTADIGDAGFASASRLTLVGGNAVREAAEIALLKWRNEDRPAVGEARWVAPPTSPPDPMTGEGVSNFSFCYGVQAVDLEVDVQTGEIHILRVVSVNDPGRVVNYDMALGQVQGAIVQALGWTITEDFIAESGNVLTDKFSTYLIPSVLDIPDRIECVFLEIADPVGPFGARGLGEIPFIPFAPAVASAVHDALGEWFDSIPLKPELIMRRLSSGKKGTDVKSLG